MRAVIVTHRSKTTRFVVPNFTCSGRERSSAFTDTRIPAFRLHLHAGADPSCWCRSFMPVQTLHAGADPSCRCRSTVPVQTLHAGADPSCRCRSTVPVQTLHAGADPSCWCRPFMPVRSRRPTISVPFLRFVRISLPPSYSSIPPRKSTPFRLRARPDDCCARETRRFSFPAKRPVCRIVTHVQRVAFPLHNSLRLVNVSPL
jgi:hypothetical protein